MTEKGRRCGQFLYAPNVTKVADVAPPFLLRVGPFALFFLLIFHLLFFISFVPFISLFMFLFSLLYLKFSYFVFRMF
jgi:hypothetical protein